MQRPVLTARSIEYLCAMQLAQGESAMQYEEALRAAGVSSLDEALKDMATEKSPAIEINEYNMTLGRTKLYITDIVRPRLVRQALDFIARYLLL